MLCAFMQQSLCKEGIASLCSAENWSNSYHTLCLPSTAAAASATMAWVEPGALSMVVAFKQVQLRNLCSNLSAAEGWRILFWNNVPKAGGLCGRVYINRAVLLHTVFGQKSTCDGSVFWSPRSSGWSSLLGWFPVHCSPAQSFELVCTDVTDSWLL